MWLVAAAQFVGIRGAIGMAAGAAMAASPSYALGRWTEAAAASERLARVLAEDQVRRTEMDHARVEAALAARLAAGGGADGGGVSDDPYRRD